jgi:hypothetical protein
MSNKRSLYCCLHAKVLDDRIRCAVGHPLNKARKDGTINILTLVRGEPLELAVCQKCNDYDEMGGPLPPDDRGWAHLLDLETTKRRGRPRKERNDRTN